MGAEVEHFPQMKVNQIDVELGGSVTLQCPHGNFKNFKRTFSY